MVTGWGGERAGGGSGGKRFMMLKGEQHDKFNYFGVRACIWSAYMPAIK